MTAVVWHRQLITDATVAAGFGLLPEVVDCSVVATTLPDAMVQVDLYTTDDAALQRHIASASATVQQAFATTVAAIVPPQDWVAYYQSNFPPTRVGRIFIHARHHPTPRDGSTRALLIEASNAFGTGEHATTQLCLSSIQDCLKKRQLRRVLDIGCGTGVLALAVAVLQPCPITAVDIDPTAVAITRQNARHNKQARRLRAYPSRGLRGVRGRFDLILANILLPPLQGLTRLLPPRLTRGGRLIVSGLLVTQMNALRAYYHAVGLRCRRWRQHRGWAVMEFEKC